MQEIGDWLEKLGMPEYGECFPENKIDLSVLPHLTDQGHWRPAWALAEDAGSSCPTRRHIHCRSTCACAWVPEAAAAPGFDLHTDDAGSRRGSAVMSR